MKAEDIPNKILNSIDFFKYESDNDIFGFDYGNVQWISSNTFVLDLLFNFTYFSYGSSV